MVWKRWRHHSDPHLQRYRRFIALTFQKLQSELQPFQTRLVPLRFTPFVQLRLLGIVIRAQQRGPRLKGRQSELLDLWARSVNVPPHLTTGSGRRKAHLALRDAGMSK